MSAHERQHFLAHPVRFFQVRRAGQDEGVGTQLHQFVQALGHLLVAADDALRLPAAQQVEAGPDVRRRDQILVAVQGGRAVAPLARRAHGIAAIGTEELAQGGRVHGVKALAHFVPRFFLRGAGHDVDAHGAFDLAAQQRRLFMHAGEFLAQLLERFQPRQVVIGMLGSGTEGRVRRSRKINLGKILFGQWRGQARVFHLIELALVGKRPAAPHAAHHVEKFRRARVAVVVTGRIAPPQLRRTAATRDDVVQGAAARGPLQAGRHARGHHGVQKAGLERDHEAEGARLARQQRGNGPRFIRHGERRNQPALEARQLGRAGDLGKIVDVGKTIGAASTEAGLAQVVIAGKPVAAKRRAGAVRTRFAMRGDAPEKIDCHVVVLLQIRGFRPLAVVCSKPPAPAAARVRRCGRLPRNGGWPPARSWRLPPARRPRARR
ncbi:hypothetical protein D3C87_1217470 [compost metagenome]